MSYPDDEEDDSMDQDDPEAPDESDMDQDDDPEVVPCPYCGADISEEAELCPRCGSYISQEETRSRKPWFVIVAVVLMLFVLTGWAIFW